MDATTARIAHLEIIQRAIDRMARESSTIKTFFALTSTAVVVLVVVVVVTSSTTTSTGAVTCGTDGRRAAVTVTLAGLFLIVIFWCMDAVYLAQERCFRELYKEASVAKNPVNFVMTPSVEIRQKHGLLQHTLWAWSTAPLYGALGMLCLALALCIVLRQDVSTLAADR
jgi:high-affinity nickel permease